MVAAGPVFSSGSYAMMDINVTDCVQLFSDVIVNSTCRLIEPDQPVPDWVNALPEGPTKREKIAFVKRYGSPNVFSQFQAHVTIGWAANETLLASAVEALRGSPLTRAPPFVGEVVALGAVGEHGTVLRGENFAEFQVA